jgi:hypothetical protein
MVVCVVGFDPRSGPAQPSPAQPGPVRPSPARAPPAPHPPLPMRPPPLPLSFGFLAQQPPSPSPTSLSPWCPRDWRRRSPEFGPRGELPSPPFSSLSPSLPLPPLLSPCACPLFFPLRARASLRGGALLLPRGAAVRPSPPRRGPCPACSPLRAASVPCARRPGPGATRVASFAPLTRSRVRKPTHAVIIFGFVVNFKLRKLACYVARFVA